MTGREGHEETTTHHDVAPLRTLADLDQAIARLARLDPGFVDHVLTVGGRPPLRRREPGFEGLAAIVVSQQVSTASAAAIFGRLKAALGSTDGLPFEAEAVAAVDDELLRRVGLSSPKIRTLRALVEAVRVGTLAFEALAAMPAAEAAARLVAVKGIGPWTAEVFLLFCLGHADAWPAGDIALQEAARIAFGLEARPDAIALTRLGERWRPYRAVAARLLWSYYRVVKRREGIGVAPKMAGVTGAEKRADASVAGEEATPRDRPPKD